MKVICFALLLSVIAISLPAQGKKINDGSVSKAASYDYSQRGGKYLTSIGKLKVLVVFAKFKGDSSSHQYWPADSFPAEMNNIIDSTIDAGSSHYLNLTNYYRQMSYGNFEVTGRSIGIETPYPLEHYIWGIEKYPDRQHANRDILKAIEDSIDYAEYDNWSFSSEYNLRNEPDGIVDMIVVIWRGIVFDPRWIGEYTLGGGDGFSVENGKIKIKFGFGANTSSGSNGSGVTVRYRGDRSPEKNFKVIIHEIAHWLLGGCHPYDQINHSFWGMLTLSNEGICANAFERERLAWLNPVLIEGTILSAPMGDFITTPSAYKYHPDNGDPGEMYYFENHQKLSIYDNGTSNPDDKGIFMLHFSNDCYSGDCVRILTSDGFWNWESPGYYNCDDVIKPSFKKASVNRRGLGNRDKITANCGAADFLYAYTDKENRTLYRDWLHGYGFNNAFNTEANDLFSAWSNPPAFTWKGEPTDFIMEILNQCGTVITVRFATANALAGKPSKPFLGIEDIDTVSLNQTFSISLAWGADFWDGLPVELDLNYSELQKRIDGGSWNTIYTGAERSWSGSAIDNQAFGKATLQFRVRVRDKQNQWSMWSNVAEQKIGNISIASVGDGIKEKVKVEKKDFMLSQNYPNPFNPETRISFTINKYSPVVLKVYNILGKEVAQLENRNLAAGTHSYNFNAASLAGGVYIYRLQAGDKAEERKMILLK